ncbi:MULTISPECIES: fimbrial protein [unclassified Serratia (in: enterobacteria)]|uniref:fimbrial protein n=1 Tax=Serratia TaxID=613 RepID=UPI000C232326|nr:MULTISPECIES: fimbrial protein [unclassified Serratia (in: enterobacteria)]MBM0402061.1 type 1 fimbrial protein [Serratia sp. 4542]PJI65700.1 fimbria A protein [Serratia sp. TKO39]HEI8819800.1 type 1 fimbrial protein [Serratia marcescens]
MKLNKIMIAAVLAFGTSSMMAQAANQGSGTITFTGEIIDAPCSIAPGNIDQTIPMGQISNLSLKDGRASELKQPVKIELEDCTSATQKTVQTTFTGQPGGATGTDNKMIGLGSGSTAKGASIVMTDNANSNAVVELGKATAGQGIKAGQEKAVLEFTAFLKGNGGALDTIVPGAFSSVVNFALNYQ